MDGQKRTETEAEPKDFAKYKFSYLHTQRFSPEKMIQYTIKTIKTNKSAVVEGDHFDDTLFSTLSRKQMKGYKVN